MGEAPKGGLADSLNSVVGGYSDNELGVYYERFDAFDLHFLSLNGVYAVFIRLLEYRLFGSKAYSTNVTQLQSSSHHDSSNS